jgi:hypothetical protein
MHSTLIPQAIESTKALFGEELSLNDESELKKWLVIKLNDMLLNDFNGLANLLYRIDVYEEKAKACFGQANSEIASCLAELIWQRQLQKVENREKYK